MTWVGQPSNRGPIPAKSKEFFISPKLLDWYFGSSQVTFQYSSGAVCPGVKQHKHEGTTHRHLMRSVGISGAKPPVSRALITCKGKTGRSCRVKLTSVYIASCILTLCIRYRWTVDVAIRPLELNTRYPITHWIGGWVNWKARLDCFLRRLFNPYFRADPVQHT
jgi:hypothetical protein